MEEKIVIFLVLFLSLLLPSSASTPLPTKFFINCGSKSPVVYDGRTFHGDESSDDSFSVRQGKAVLNADSSAPVDIYQTARIIRQPSSYDFDVDENRLHLVRLHFFPFNSQGTNLVNGRFNVSAKKILFLSDFSVRNSTKLPEIKEFILNIPTSKFRIYFVPAAADNSFAFVNAIEVLLLPQKFIADKFIPVPPVKTAYTTDGLNSKALRTLYSVNVGGSAVSDSSALWRRWVPDDGYLISNGSAQRCKPYSGSLRRSSESIEFIAPDAVYMTCKEVVNSSFPNLTWRFEVNKNTRHYIRLHFCDIVSTSVSNSPDFSVYIYRDFNQTIGSQHVDFRSTAVPFFVDFVVQSDNSGYINISISPNESFAYLNGMEVMEFVENSGFELPLPDDHHGPPIVVIAVVCSVVLVLILMVLVFFGLKCKKSKSGKASAAMAEPAYGRGKSPIWVSEKPGYVSPVPNLNLTLKMPLAEILAATQNFNEKLLIGEGGFGKVYKGTLLGGTKVAVKRSDSSHGQGLYEFQTEVLVLSKIRHRHLVSLIGYCDDGDEMILVYEFMEKGTLRDHLYNWKENSNAKLSGLTWKERLEICIGSAKGLHYLHAGLDGGIIHRDVKSTNILLDEDYVAKVADFGLSQSGPPDPDHFSTDVKGSFGYLDPDFHRTLQLTEKSDVYSFGVVLLEVLCARPAIVNSHQREEINLAEWGMFWQKKGQLEKIIDPFLVGHINPNSLRKFGEVAEKCLKSEGADRPAMLDVCWDLEYALQLQKTAVHREPYDDSTTDVSMNTMLPFGKNLEDSSVFPSQEHSLSTGVDDDESDFSTAGVFSQQNIDGAR